MEPVSQPDNDELGPRAVRIVGPGRAGGSFADALAAVGLKVEVCERNDPVARAAEGVDAVLICTPDHAIRSVAAAIEPATAAVLHCSGATGLGALGNHPRVGSIHPLMALPDRASGASRLRSGGWFAVDGDPIVVELVRLLGGRCIEVRDADRAAYHATAAVAANHLVALMGQVERLAASIGVGPEAFFELAAGSFEDVRRVGAASALTGPAARSDHATLDRHRAALPAGEVSLYDALSAAAARLARQVQQDEAGPETEVDNP